MEVKSFTFNDYQENTYLIIEDSSCIIIDPGNYYEEENNLIIVNDLLLFQVDRNFLRNNYFLISL